MDFPFKRIFFIIFIVIAALVIFVSAWMKNYRADTLQSFSIPSLPVSPSAALLHMTTANKPRVKNLLNFPVTPAKAWVLELPDIKNPTEAENLVQTLRRKGFNAYSLQHKSLLGVLTRIFVGPEIKPEQMEHVAKQLNTEMHLTTQPVPFDPLLYQ